MSSATINTITEVKFVNDVMIIKVNEQIINVRLADVSLKLVAANDAERNDFRISPTGYGIHWNQLDEDLSLSGLMNRF